MHLPLLEELNRLHAPRPILEAALRYATATYGLSGGWTWQLERRGRTFFLAAAHRLPAALRVRHDLLGGYCWCLEQFQNGQLNTADNVSEIKCSRLDKVFEAAVSLRYHVSVPLEHAGRQLGLMNLIHEEEQHISAAQLDELAVVGRHTAAALARAVDRQRAEAIGEQRGQQHTARRLHRLLSASLSGMELRVTRLAGEQPSTELKALLNQLSSLRNQLDELTAAAAEPPTPSPPTPTPDYPAEPLTERELEVLRLVATGGTNRALAKQLFISERTVKFHLSNLLAKLDATTRTEAVAVARERSIL